jgi:hypothetical protein
MTTTAPGQGIALPGLVFRKLSLPQALHREPETTDHDHAGYSG